MLFRSLSGASTETALQIGYTVADLIAKAGVGVLIYLIAVRKSAVEYGDDSSMHATSQPAPNSSR